jgi:hypothetical protein
MLHLGLPTQLGFHGSKEVRHFIRNCLEGLYAGYGGFILARPLHVNQSAGFFVDKLMLPVKQPGFGQVRVRTCTPHAVGNPQAQAALLRVSEQFLRPTVAKQERTQLALEMHVLDVRRLKITLYLFHRHNRIVFVGN